MNYFMWQTFQSDMQARCFKVFEALKTSLYRIVHNIFRYVEPFRHGRRVWQTDRRTYGRTDEAERPLAIAQFNVVKRALISS